MGTDYQPTIVFGLKIPEDKIVHTIEHTINRCKCLPQTDTGKYCPKCGRHISLKETKRESKFDGFESPFKNEPLFINGWPVTFFGEYHIDFYVGFYTFKGYYCNHAADKKGPLPDMSKEERFITDMMDAGVWDEDNYGAWLVLDISY